MNRKFFVLIVLSLAAIVLSNAILFGHTVLSSKRLYSDSPDHWINVISVVSVNLISYILPWLGLLGLILYFLRRFPWPPERPGRFVRLHLAICFIFSLAQFLIHAIFEPDTGLYFGDFAYRLILALIDYFSRNLVFTAGVVGIHQALAGVRQLRRKDVEQARLAEALAEARLSSLKMKLQPHFLFNALQSINVLILDRQIEPASEMLARLSILLRHSLDQDDCQLVTVEAELETVRNYLAIEEIRFKDRLQVGTTVEPGTRNALIPGLLLQPLIENAIRHGLARKAGPGRIDIEIRRAGNCLAVSIRNDGPSLAAGWNFSDQAGFGLRATQKRLELLYGNDGRLEIRSLEEGGVRVDISIPFSVDLLANTGQGRA
jgi:two-component system, LytTR family, sensor kinase